MTEHNNFYFIRLVDRTNGTLDALYALDIFCKKFPNSPCAVCYECGKKSEKWHWHIALIDIPITVQALRNFIKKTFKIAGNEFYSLTGKYLKDTIDPLTNIYLYKGHNGNFNKNVAFNPSYNDTYHDLTAEQYRDLWTEYSGKENSGFYIKHYIKKFELEHCAKYNVHMCNYDIYGDEQCYHTYASKWVLHQHKMAEKMINFAHINTIVTNMKIYSLKTTFSTEKRLLQKMLDQEFDLQPT